jgi:hypothetical protein
MSIYNKSSLKENWRIMLVRSLKKGNFKGFYGH